MKIITPGVIRKLTRILQCPKCFCVFSADEGEYCFAFGGGAVEIRAECPFCGDGGYKLEKR